VAFRARGTGQNDPTTEPCDGSIRVNTRQRHREICVRENQREHTVCAAAIPSRHGRDGSDSDFLAALAHVRYSALSESPGALAMSEKCQSRHLAMQKKQPFRRGSTVKITDLRIGSSIALPMPAAPRLQQKQQPLRGAWPNRAGSLYRTQVDRGRCVGARRLPLTQARRRQFNIPHQMAK
jgi:hypothetical protein